MRHFGSLFRLHSQSLSATAEGGLGFLLLLLTACSAPPDPPFHPADPLAQAPYFPLQIGKYVDYAVDSVVFDFSVGGGTQRDSTHTLVREMVTDTFRNPAGEQVFVVERYERAGEADPWALRRVLSASRSETQAVRTEDNLRFLKLVFPLDRRSAWNGNLWIDPYQEVEIAGERLRPFLNWHYEVDSIDVPAQVGAFVFDSTLLVTEVDETNAIERRLSRVRYAKHVGVVWREVWILDSQYCNQVPPPADCTTKPWEEKAEKGYILRQKMTGHN